jgi:hypothetical protein
MSLMRGHFYVYYSSHPKFGEVVNILHGRDSLPYDESSPEDREMEDLIRESYEEQTGRKWISHVDPEELRTGQTEPQSVWLPIEVWNALVMRAYDRMTPEERKAASGDTRWEKQWAKDFGLDEDEKDNDG